MSTKYYNTKVDDCQYSEDIVEVFVYPDMVQVKQKLQYKPENVATRKECKGFSDDSRRRLMQKMAMWNLSDLNLYFVTVTYPGIYAKEWQVWKRDVDTFIKALGRNYDCAVGCLWRIEFQKRGAPHFHMILATNKQCKNVGLLRREIAIYWANIVKDGYLQNGGKWEEYEQHHKNHIKAGTNVEQVQGRKQLMAYVSKYVAKNTGINAPEKFGRNWGFRDINGELDFSPVEVVRMGNREANKLKRMIRGWLRSRGQKKYSVKIRHVGSYSVFGLGVDSLSKNAIYRMIKSAIRSQADELEAGLLAPHNFPCRSASRFTDRLAIGVYGEKHAITQGMRVDTPYGKATVERVVYVEALKSIRIVTITDNWVKNSKHHVFYAYELKKQENVKYEQNTLEIAKGGEIVKKQKKGQKKVKEADIA